MNVDAASTAVDTAAPPPSSLPLLNAETGAPPPVSPPSTETPKPSIRDGIESGLKALQSERSRDEAGRFAPEAKDKPAPAPVTPAAQPAVQPPVVAKPAVERPANMPKAWGADKATLWSGLTPEVAAYIQERERGMEEFHARHAGIQRWQEAATANGTNLNDVLERVNDVESTMISDPSQGLVKACQMVGLDKQAAIGALQGALRQLGVVAATEQSGGAYPPAGREAAATPQAHDVAAIIERAVEQRVGPIVAEQRQRAVGEAEAKVKAFFADPANKYANELHNEISGELKAMRAMGQQPDLPKAYERALWLRPDLREKLVTEQFAEKQKAQEVARTQELEKSRSASRSVAGSPSTATGRSSADKPSNLREGLTQAVRALAGRV